MQTLALKKPLTTKEAQVAVQAGLKPGRYRVQLVVTGPSGSSQPAAMTINVVEAPPPTPPIRPIDLTPVRTTGRIGRVVKTPTQKDSVMGAIDPNLVDAETDDLVADALAARGVPERVNYATGVLLDAGDFGDEQTYLRGRQARALAAVCGHGTLAGLRVSCPLTVTDAAGSPRPNGTLEVHVAPGLALDRLGRLIEVRATQCIAITRWLANLAAQPASDLDRVRLIDALRDADAPANAPDSGRVLVLDVFLRFVVCPHGRTPAFAAGPFNATDYVVPSRLADGFEMTLQIANAVRAQPADPADTSTVLAVPAPRSSALQAMQDALAGIANAAERAAATRAYALASVLDAWPTADAIDPTRLPKLREHASDADWDRVLLGRVTVPVAQATPGAFPTPDTPRLADPGADRDLADNTLRPIVFNPLAWRGAI